MSSPLSAIDFEDFHAQELPRRIAAGHGSAAAPGVSDLGPLGLRISGSDRCYSYVPTPGGVEIVPGDAPAETVVALPAKSWEGLVHDLESPAALLYHGEVERVRGDLMDFVRWEAGLRALYTGRPVYDPDQLDLRDRDGSRLDPLRSFSLDDDPEDMAHFLREVGYLFVKRVFSAPEIERFCAAAEELRARAVPGDQRSWWAKSPAGEEVLCRVIQAGTHPGLASLHGDARIARLAALTDTRLVSKGYASDRDGVSVLWKNPGIAEGLSDLPWHRDCGMGGHTAMCPTLVGSIFLERNTPEAGALRFLPGSWKMSYRVADARDAHSLDGVVIPAEPGDLTLHYGDGWHAAPPPTSERGPFRSCLLVSFQREDAYNHRGERHYNDVLLGDQEGQIKDMRRVASEY